jgi:hypothetical protein
MTFLLISPPTPFSSMTSGHSPGGGPGPLEPPPTRSSHCADAKETEIAVIERFLHAIESAFGPEAEFRPEFAAAAFVDFLVEARKLERLNDRGRSSKSRISIFTWATLLPFYLFNP